MPKMYISFLLNFFQPITQNPQIIDKVTRECYLPVVNIFNCNLNPQFTISIANSLIDLLQDCGKDRVINGLCKAVKDGKIEIVHTGASHPIFPLIPKSEVSRQIDLDIKYKKMKLGVNGKTGIFSHELCYDDSLIGLFKEKGFKWTIIDDQLMEMHGIKIPEHEIYNIDKFHVFMRSAYWSNMLRNTKGAGNKSWNGEDFVRILSEDVKNKGNDCYKIIAIPVETFGHHIECYDLFLREMLSAINKSESIRLCQVSDLIEINSLSKIEKPEEIDKNFSRFPQSSWATRPEDAKRGAPYPHWQSKGNPIHEKLWELANLIFESCRGIDFEMKNSKGLRKLLDEAFYSCIYYWASIWFWDRELVSSGIDLQMRALYKCVRFTGNTNVMEKGKEIYTSLMWEIYKRDLEETEKWIVNQCLFEKGTAAYENADFFKSLECFLKLKDKRLDFIHNWNTGGEIRKIQLLDVNFDTIEEIGVLSKQERFSIFSLHDTFSANSLNSFNCRGFCFFRWGRNEACIAIATQENEGDSLYIYKIITSEDRQLEFNEIIKLDPIEKKEIVLDISFKRQKIYISTTKQKVYRYNAVSFEKEEVFNTSANFQRLFTGGKDHDDCESPFYNNLMGLSNDGQLVLYDIGLGEFQDIFVISKETSFFDAFIIDIDNCGFLDIIACSQDGRVFVYDIETMRAKYEFKCFDEFNCIFCDDIDFDGNIEILLGTKSNYIYVLGINNDNNEIEIKWKYKTNHQIWALRISKGSGDENKCVKELVVGLSNGEIQVFKVFAPKYLNREISKAYKALLEKKDRGELFKLLSGSQSPEVIRFGLDQYARELSCDMFIDFLTNIEKSKLYKLNIQILPKLKYFLNKFPTESTLIDYIKGFVKRLFDQNQDMPTCERICSTLDEIKRESLNNSNAIFQLSIDFNGELRKRKFREPEKLKKIDELIFKNELIKANDELEELEHSGVDLLKVYQSTDGISKIYYSEDIYRIVTITIGKSINFLDVVTMNCLKTMRFTKPELHYFPISYSGFEHLIFHATKAELYDKDYNSINVFSYDYLIQCAQVFTHKDKLVWIIGQRNGKIIIHGIDMDRIEFEVPTYPVKFIKIELEDGRVDLFMITLDCKIYVIEELLNALKPSLLFDMGEYINILDFVVIEEKPYDIGFIIISDRSLYLIKHRGGKFQKIEISLNKSLSCAALIDFNYNGSNEIIIGTWHRSLLFLTLEGEIQKELYLPSIPTALCPIKTNKNHSEIMVGFENGTLHHYRFIHDSTIRELKKRCNKEKQYEDSWGNFPLKNKLVLIALAQKQNLNIEGIHEELDFKIRLFFRKEEFFESVLILEKKEILRKNVRGEDVYYSCVDDNFGIWVMNHYSEFDAAQIHLEEIIENVRLVEIWEIDAELKKRDALEWIFDFGLITTNKWNDLVSLSKPLARIYSQDSNEKQADTLNYLNFFCSKIQAEVKKTSHSTAPISSIISTFSLQMPLVKFQGFNKIMFILLKDQASINVDSFSEWIKSDHEVKIVILFSLSRNEFLLSSLKNSFFNPVMMDQNDLKKIILSEAPREEFFNCLIDQINITTLSPFQLAGPVSEMFYGRNIQQKMILNSFIRPDAKNYAVIGPRRIGKTSLLLKMKNEVESMNNFRFVYLDCTRFGEKIDDWYQAILTGLEIKLECEGIQYFVNSIKEYLKKNKCKLVLFLDEVDELLKNEEKQNHLFTDTLRALINECNVKILIAGYKILYFQMKDNSSPLFNLLEPIELGSLETESAISLIKEPFQNIYKINSENVEHILKMTACYPNFIQFCCDKLIKISMEYRTRIITKGAIDSVTTSTDFYDFVINVYLQNLDDKSKTILYLMMCHYDPYQGKFISDKEQFMRLEKSEYAHTKHKYGFADTFTPYDLHRILEVHKINLSHNELDIEMKKMVLASILKPSQMGKEYSLILPELPRILKMHMEIEEITLNLLEKSEKEFN